MTHFVSHPFVRNFTLICWNTWVGEQGPLSCPPMVPSVCLVGFYDEVFHSQDWSRTPIPLTSASQVPQVQECATMSSYFPSPLPEEFLYPSRLSSMGDLPRNGLVWVPTQVLSSIFSYSGQFYIIITNTWEIQHKEGKIHCCSLLESFQFMAHCFWARDEDEYHGRSWGRASCLSNRKYWEKSKRVLGPDTFLRCMPLTTTS